MKARTLKAGTLASALVLLLMCGFVSSLGSVPAKKKSAAKSAESPKNIGAAGLISVAEHQLELDNFQAAFVNATSAAQKAPMLDDYAQYIRAQAAYGLKNYNEVISSCTRVFNQTPISPFIGSAAALAVRADLDNNSPKQALELIKKYFERIPEPQADLLLARTFDATGDLPQAAEYYQRVYYGYPTSKEAADAANALVDIKGRLGDAYPPPMPTAMLERAQKLFDAKNAAAARVELAAAIPQLGGAQLDVARVRLGVADFLGNNPRAAFEYLVALKVDDPEADAERLSYIIHASRKLDKHSDVKPYLDQLERQHPNSRWRLDSLILVADQARSDNDAGTYLPLYRACAAGFADDDRAGWCHWRVAFDSYRHDADDAYDLLRKQIQQYPGSDDANDALYFLGRLAERKHDEASARACYDELVRLFPNTYYAIVARDRLKQPSIQAATPNSDMLAFLRSIAWPARPEFPSFTPGKTAEIRIGRAKLLQDTGLSDFADSELKFGAANDGEQENVYAFQLAQFATARNAPDQAMRYIKHYTPGYLYVGLDQAPVDFWRLAFPLPYRASIENYSHLESLDPFLVAALIRQESEFNVKVISHANAYGLMQLLPTTGRDLARHFRVKGYSTSQLLTADRNVQLGTYYFHNLLDSFGGQPELALASYNAGPGRAKLWNSWGPFREQAEFIETVPFHETRGYIQIVLRNADVYKRLYAGSIPDVPAYRPKPAPKPMVKKKLHKGTAARVKGA